MRARLAALCEVDSGDVETSFFPDGERYSRIMTSVDGREVVVIGGTISDADTLELYDLASAIVKYGARRLTVVIPYFGYSTMERAVKRGEIVTAKTRARLLSSIPQAGAPNRVLLLDLHAEGIPYYFVGAARAYLEAGATSLAAITTHALFPGDALARIEASNLFTKIACTDSHPRALELKSDFLQVESVVPIFAGALGLEPRAATPNV
jgi:phosphoribosylpyrophosphate synthetase